MKNIRSFLLALSLLVATVSSFPVNAWQFCGFCIDEDSFDFATEFRVAYYSPSSSKVRHIYGSGWADYQLELSTAIGKCGWRAWAGVSGFSQEGHSIGCDIPTTLQLIPLSFGLKYEYPFSCCFKGYVGGAAVYSFLSIHDHSHYLHQHENKGAWGGLLQIGLKYQFACWGYVNVFCDYLFQTFSFHNYSLSSRYGYSYYYDSFNIERNHLNLNGCKLGAGIGFVF